MELGMARRSSQLVVIAVVMVLGMLLLGLIPMAFTSSAGR